MGRNGHAGAGALAVLLAAFLAGCGGSSGGKKNGLAAACARQKPALAAVGNPVGLSGATRALRRVIAMDRELLAVLTQEQERLVVRIQRLDTNARRGLASIQSDPDRSMSPLRTGTASVRRVLSAAQSLLNAACANQS